MTGTEKQIGGLKVIGAGLPRTSTVSLQSAFQILGFNPTYHTISDLLPNAASHGPKWRAAMLEKDKVVRQKILREIVRGYEAVTNGPACLFVEDWVEMFPDAKVVLTLRNSPEAWLKSVNSSIGAVFGKPLAYYITYFVSPMHQGFLLSNLWDKQILGKYSVGVRSEEYYDFHNNHIRTVVPKERLLEFRAQDGWVPLCKFLGKDNPTGENAEYPHKNDSKAANIIIREFAIWGWVFGFVWAWQFMGVFGELGG